LHAGLASPWASELAETSDDWGATGLGLASEGAGELSEGELECECWCTEGGVGSGRASSDMAPGRELGARATVAGWPSD